LFVEGVVAGVVVADDGCADDGGADTGGDGGADAGGADDGGADDGGADDGCADAGDAGDGGAMIVVVKGVVGVVDGQETLQDISWSNGPHALPFPIGSVITFLI